MGKLGRAEKVDAIVQVLMKKKEQMLGPIEDEIVQIRGGKEAGKYTKKVFAALPVIPENWIWFTKRAAVAAIRREREEQRGVSETLARFYLYSCDEAHLDRRYKQEVKGA